MVSETFHKRNFNDNFTAEEMEQIREIDAFIRRICLYHGEDFLGEYKGQYFFLCCKSAYHYRGEELSCFVNKYISVKDFEYKKIDCYVAKCIYRLIQNRHIEVFYAVNSFKAGYTASGKCYPQRTNECVCFSNAVFTDIDLPQEMHDLENETVLEMLRSTYKELFVNVPISLAVRSGGGLHLYYELSQTVDLRNESMKVLWKDTMRCLQQIFKDAGSDIRVIDATRILRLPYSINRKEKYGPKGKRVNVVYDGRVTYDLEELNRKLHFIEQGGMATLLEEVLEEIDNITFSGALDEETMFVPVDVSEEEDVFKDVAYVEPPRRKNMTEEKGCTVWDAEKDSSLTDDTEFSSVKDMGLQVAKKNSKKDTKYKGIAVDYESIPGDFWQNRDVLFWVLNRGNHEGYRHSLLFVLGFNWYHIRHIRSHDELYQKWTEVNQLLSPPLEDAELEVFMKGAYATYRKRDIYRCICNKTIQQLFEFTEEEKEIVAGCYYDTKEENEKKRKKNVMKSYYKGLKKKGKISKKEEKENIRQILLEHPQMTYEEFEQKTGKSKYLFKQYKKELGIASKKGRPNTKEKYLSFFETEEDTSEEAFMEKFHCSSVSYRRYKKMYLDLNK